eukprot:TRINITY_DN63090_c0_g1_i1.p1 TRINITY_DN63090_c0_g1~~TRINITY_DN63090_c0_g1_i1.p1  ORF type:complete len:124 (-),score=36.37 TRINITY_DN63090_c0_g1_i1:80-397(-)
MLRSLVGSEMCIRDSCDRTHCWAMARLVAFMPEAVTVFLVPNQIFLDGLGGTWKLEYAVVGRLAPARALCFGVPDRGAVRRANTSREITLDPFEPTRADLSLIHI